MKTKDCKSFQENRGIKNNKTHAQQKQEDTLKQESLYPVDIQQVAP